jgi:hypothetical protein
MGWFFNKKIIQIKKHKKEVILKTIQRNQFIKANLIVILSRRSVRLIQKIQNILFVKVL